jgi:DNA invertase Pin-like site-specific DNA recombinase
MPQQRSPIERRAYNKAHPHARQTGLGQVIRVESEVLKKMPAGDYLKGKYSKRTKTVMRLLRQGHLSQAEIATKVGVSRQRVWTINKSYLKRFPNTA